MPAKLNSIIGREFGRLKVIQEAPRHITPCGAIFRQSVCKCRCGNTVTVFNNALLSGASKSCGCFRLERLREVVLTHGHSNPHSKTYNSWASMIQRCTNPKDRRFKDYGAVGIKVCKRWRNSFEAFLADMGECPPKLSIDRWPNPHGNYDISNCRWATRKQQQRNLRKTKIFTIRGITGCLPDLCERFSIDSGLVHGRLKIGWDVERAFTTPSLRRKQ